MRAKNKICRCNRPLKLKENEVLLKDTLRREGSLFLCWIDRRSGGSRMFKYLCNKGHTHEISVGNFKQGKRCIICRDIATSKRRSLPTSTWESRFKTSEVYKGDNFIFIGYDKKVRKILYKCLSCEEDCYSLDLRSSSTFYVTPESLNDSKQVSCRCREGFHNLNDEELKYYLTKNVLSNRQSLIKVITEGYKRKVIIKCVCGVPDVKLLVTQIKVHGFECGGCGDRGYGFNGTLPYKLYLVKWSDSIKGEEYLKIGITRNTVSSRIKNQKIRTNFIPRILSVYKFKDGYSASIAELEVKSLLKSITQNVEKALFCDGFTETFKITSEVDIEVIKAIILEKLFTLK